MLSLKLYSIVQVQPSHKSSWQARKLLLLRVHDFRSGMHFQTPSYQHRYGKEVTETLLRPLWICRSADPKLSLSRAAKLSAQRPSPASEPCFDAHVSLPLEGRGNYRTSCRAVSQRHPETRCTWIRPRMHGRATVFICINDIHIQIPTP